MFLTIVAHSSIFIYHVPYHNPLAYITYQQSYTYYISKNCCTLFNIHISRTVL